MSNFGQILKNRGEECWTYLRYWRRRKHVPTKRFVIYTHWRSGSSLLVDLLNSNSQIHCDSEIFLDFLRLGMPRVLSPHWYIYGKASRIKRQVYGFKLMTIQLKKILINRWHGEPHEFLEYMHDNGWKIIHLKRKDIFRKAVSALVAQSTNRWHVKEGDPQRGKLTIDPECLLTRMKGYEDTMRKEEIYLKDIPHLSIVYEDGLLEARNHQKTMDTVYAYIGVPPALVKTQWKKIIPVNLSETIENYQEIYDVVGKTPFARFLDSQVGGTIPGSRVG